MVNPIKRVSDAFDYHVAVIPVVRQFIRLSYRPRSRMRQTSSATTGTQAERECI